MQSAIDEALGHWRSKNVALNPPATRQAVLDAFAGLGYAVTADICDLYQCANGFHDNEYCENFWTLWSLEKISAENAFNDTAPDVICFADYLICSHYFGFHRESDQVSSVHIQLWYGDSVDSWQVAGSVQEFLFKLIRHPDDVWVFPLKTETRPDDTLVSRIAAWFARWR